MGMTQMRTVFVRGNTQPVPCIKQRNFSAEIEVAKHIQQKIAHSLGPLIDGSNKDKAYNPNAPTIQSTY
jgi:hypothetical protein